MGRQLNIVIFFFSEEGMEAATNRIRASLGEDLSQH